MAPPVNALRPIPNGISLFALVTHSVFHTRIAADPNLEALSKAHDKKIARFF